MVIDKSKINHKKIMFLDLCLFVSSNSNRVLLFSYSLRIEFVTGVSIETNESLSLNLTSIFKIILKTWFDYLNPVLRHIISHLLFTLHWIEIKNKELRFTILIYYRSTCSNSSRISSHSIVFVSTQYLQKTFMHDD